ncbi:hypothetical protein Patl1_12472 [Pistacia atlantica]|uniref:Uncharacterized protein n=1 Tax=Pistacia atlantica TaxID=434234 RepID=A0ACC1AU62_9ROSI|nr:hypothetical protein Patl1_12472 [Pistacia atlantica]
MLSLQEELVYLILQFLDEEGFEETLHKLEQETKIFFNINYFREYMISAEWDKAEEYLSAFTKMDDNTYSMKMFSEMRKQNHLEVVGRQNKLMSEYAGRTCIFDALEVLIKENPILQDKLKFPSMDKSRLLKLVRQLMDWWVPYCVNSKPNANNDIIPLEDFPTVPYLLHAPSFVTNDSSPEGISGPSSDGVREYSCMKSNDSSCCTDVNQSRESSRLADANSLLGLKPIEKSVIWKLQQINEPSECRTFMLPDNSVEGKVYLENILKVVQLIYSYTGDFVLALAQNAIHKLWTWRSDKCFSGKAIANVEPHLYQPPSELIMINEIGAHSKNAVSCCALKGSYLFSASGGKISIFSLETFETLTTFANPPPTATYFIFLPQDLFAIGLDDSSILIHCPYTKMTKAKLEGHQNRITCLEFSYKLNVLVSSGADAQLCVWDVNGWKKLCSKLLQNLHVGLVPETPVVNHIQFHPDQVHLLAVHERQIDVYKAPTLDHMVQLVPKEVDLPITFATYSSDGKAIYVSCKSGCVKVFATKTLELRCQINLTAYAQLSSTSLELYPLVVAAHPSEPNQIAVGLTNGRVHILEPLQSEVEWGMLRPDR